MIPVSRESDPERSTPHARLYRLYHVPARYYFPDADPSELKQLHAELERVGYIALDVNGEPCCLSGFPRMDV